MSKMGRVIAFRQRQYVGGGCGAVYGHGGHLDGAALHAREVKNIVDNGQQRLPAIAGSLRKVALFTGQFRIQ